MFKNLSDCINLKLEESVYIATPFDVTVSRFGLSRSLQMSLRLIMQLFQ